MSVAFYESQPPWSPDPGGICSYVIERSKLLAAGGVDVWWCNSYQSARWCQKSLEWVDITRHPASPRMSKVPNSVRHVVASGARVVEVSEVAPIWGWSLDAKLVLHWHTAASTRRWLNRVPVQKLRDRYRFFRERHLARLAHRVLAPSMEMAFLQAGRYDVHPERVTVLPHWFYPKEEGQDTETAEGYVLMAGNLEYFKGFDLMVAALDLHRQRGGRLHLRFAGCEGASDPHPAVARMLSTQSVRDALARHGPDLVRFLGRLSHADLSEVQRHANATVVASRFENFTMVAGEAVFNGCPVLLSDRCGWRLPAALSDGAVIVDPHDAEAMADALDHVADPENRMALVAGAKRLAQWISSPRLAEKTVSFYKQLILAESGKP